MSSNWRILALILAALATTQAQARIHRSHAAIAQFKHLHPCPATSQAQGRCPGWIIDHIIALACGGADDPSNMQWQTKADAHLKDKWERIGCKTSQ